MTLYAKFNAYTNLDKSSGLSIPEELKKIQGLRVRTLHPENACEVTARVESWQSHTESREGRCVDSTLVLLGPYTACHAGSLDGGHFPKVYNGTTYAVAIPKAAFDIFCMKCEVVSEILDLTLEGLAKLEQDYQKRQGPFAGME